jgi:flagellar M-ring protein FliF
MTARLRETWAAWTAALRALPSGGRALAFAIALGSVVLVVAAAWWVGRPLATHTAPADAGRPLEDALADAVAALGGVSSARVRLVRPDGADRRPSASVIVAQSADRELAPAQLDAVTHLVAASVEGLSPDAVTVTDQAGRVLTAERRSADGAAGAAGANSVEYQRAVERATEERIESLLATVVGPGRVIARVAAAVDFARTERTEETYDPDRTVVRETRSTREASADAKDADAAKPRVGPDAAGRLERRDETQTYEVSKTTSRTVEPVGAVKRLSVAVLIDGTYRDDNGRRVFVARSDDELARLRTLAASAAGITEERGDRLEVTSVPFQASATEPASARLDPSGERLTSIAGRLLAVALVVAVLALLVRPLVQAVARNVGTAQVAAAREGTVAELTRKNAALARENPERAAALVRRWLVEGREPTV